MAHLNLSTQFCKMWHTVIVALHLIAGLLLVFLMAVEQQPDLFIALLSAVLVIVAGTLCFGLFPLVCIAASVFTRFVPIAALPIFALYALCHLIDHKGNISFLTWQMALICSALSMWGLFNFKTAQIANKDETFNPIMVFGN